MRRKQDNIRLDISDCRVNDMTIDEVIPQSSKTLICKDSIECDHLHSANKEYDARTRNSIENLIGAGLKNNDSDNPIYHEKSEMLKIVSAKEGFQCSDVETNLIPTGENTTDEDKSLSWNGKESNDSAANNSEKNGESFFSKTFTENKAESNGTKETNETYDIQEALASDDLKSSENVQQNAFKKNRRSDDLFDICGRDEIIWDQWEGVRLLGEGVYGRVYLVQNKTTKERRAFKRMYLNCNRSNDNRSAEPTASKSNDAECTTDLMNIFKNTSGGFSCVAQREISILALLKGHENVIELEKVYVGSHRVYLSFPVIEGGNLGDFLRLYCTYQNYLVDLAHTQNSLEANNFSPDLSTNKLAGNATAMPFRNKKDSDENKKTSDEYNSSSQNSLTSESSVDIVSNRCDPRFYSCIVPPSYIGLPLDLVRKIMKQVISAVEWCHIHRVTHRDIKPDNLLVKWREPLQSDIHNTRKKKIKELQNNNDRKKPEVFPDEASTNSSIHYRDGLNHCNKIGTANGEHGAKEKLTDNSSTAIKHKKGHFDEGHLIKENKSWSRENSKADSSNLTRECDIWKTAKRSEGGAHSAREKRAYLNDDIHADDDNVNKMKDVKKKQEIFENNISMKEASKDVDDSVAVSENQNSSDVIEGQTTKKRKTDSQNRIKYSRGLAQNRKSSSTQDIDLSNHFERQRILKKDDSSNEKHDNNCLEGETFPDAEEKCSKTYNKDSKADKTKLNDNSEIVDLTQIDLSREDIDIDSFPTDILPPIFEKVYLADFGLARVLPYYTPPLRCRLQVTPCKKNILEEEKSTAVCEKNEGKKKIENKLDDKSVQNFRYVSSKKADNDMTCLQKEKQHYVDFENNDEENFKNSKTMQRECELNADEIEHSGRKRKSDTNRAKNKEDNQRQHRDTNTSEVTTASESGSEAENDTGDSKTKKKILETGDYKKNLSKEMKRKLPRSKDRIVKNAEESQEHDSKVPGSDGNNTKTWKGEHVILSPEIITLNYRPLEVLMGLQQYDVSVDVWSLGCIMAELLLGRELFEGNTEVQVIMEILKLFGTPQKTSWPSWSTLPFVSSTLPAFPTDPYGLERIFLSHNRLDVIQESLCLDLLKKLLEVNPEKRITANAALKHAFFESDK